MIRDPPRELPLLWSVSNCREVDREENRDRREDVAGRGEEGSGLGGENESRLMKPARTQSNEQGCYHFL